MELNKEMATVIVEEYFELHNYAEATLNNTKAVINNFNQFLNKTKRSNDFRDIKEKDYYDFMDYLKSRKKIKNSTISTRLSSLRKIFVILESEEKLLINPFAGIKPMKASLSIRDKILSEKEINELLEYYDLKSTIGFRDRTVFEVLYETGIRCSELVNLELDDFVKEERLLFIRNGKGKKDRLVPLGDSAYQFLVKYVEKVRKRLVKRRKRKYLFVSVRGIKLNNRSVWGILNRGYEKGKISKRIHPHMLRHTCATHLLKNGAGIREIQLLLGHKTIKSTQIYINLNNEHLRKEYEKYHPLENELYFDVFEREAKVINGELENNKQLSKKGLTVK